MSDTIPQLFIGGPWHGTLRALGDHVHTVETMVPAARGQEWKRDEYWPVRLPSGGVVWVLRSDLHAFQLTPPQKPRRRRWRR